MKLALDFDGVVVDVLTSEYINQPLFFDFILQARNRGWDVELVTARPVINKGYIERKTLKRLNVVCCESNEEKVKYINKNNFDIVIDDTDAILNNVNSPIPLKFKNWILIDKLLFRPKLLAPGPVTTKYNCFIDFCHREEKFFNLYKDTKEKLLTAMDAEDMNVLFIQGSGTSAVETALLSYKYWSGKMAMFTNGTFGDRAIQIAEAHGLDYEVFTDLDKLHKELTNPETDVTAFFGVQFETSKSIENDFGNILKVCNEKSMFSIVDSVSALGFYPMPDSDVVCSSSSKILRGLPAMGLLFYKKKFESNLLQCDNGYYLNVKRYIEHDKKAQTPHTSLQPQLMSLNHYLDKRVSRDNIITNCEQMLSMKYKLTGDVMAPVLTIKLDEDKIDKMVAKLSEFNYTIYRNKIYMKDYFQVATFADRNPEVYKFFKQILEGYI